MTLPTLVLIGILLFPTHHQCEEHMVDVALSIREDSKVKESIYYSFGEGKIMIELYGAHAILECKEGEYRAYLLEDR